MQDKTINNALLALRKQIIRSNGARLEHVEALLEARGVPTPRVMPAKRQDAARRGHMSLIVLDALRDGPKPAIQVTAHVAPRRPEITPEAAKQRTSQCLTKLKVRGLVALDGLVWRLA